MKSKIWYSGLFVAVLGLAVVARQTAPRSVPIEIDRPVTVIVRQTVEVPITIRVVETVLIPISTTPTFSKSECTEMLVYYNTMNEIIEKRAGILEDEIQWKKRVSEQSSELVRERANEFWEQWHDLRIEVSSISFPLKLKETHNVLERSVQQQLRSLEYLQAYYQTGLESDRAKANEALSEVSNLAEDYFYQLFEVFLAPCLNE